MVSVYRDEQTIVPTGELLIKAGDNLIVIANKESMPGLEKVFVG